MPSWTMPRPVQVDAAAKATRHIVTSDRPAAICDDTGRILAEEGDFLGLV